MCLSEMQQLPIQCVTADYTHEAVHVRVHNYHILTPYIFIS